ncbi:outer dynein arm-docking complex subunit 3-like [Labrus bergylta]|uniref:outer dynein arm-docking complex subunit 3-like n=1 Tax=Labrus bergylta TaxID=56723 RepID=UPI003313606F
MSAKDLRKAPLKEQLEKARIELRLVEAERAAIKDRTEASVNKTKAAIDQLKQQNEQLRKQNIAEANKDANVIKAAFPDRPDLLRLLSNMSVEEALTTLKRRNLSILKRINAVDHGTKNDKCQGEERGGSHSAAVQTQKQEDDCKYLSELKKCVYSIEAECDMTEKRGASEDRAIVQLQEEALGYPASRKQMEAERQKDRKELEELQSRVTIAENFNEASKAELKQLELYYNEKITRAESTKVSKRKQLKELQAQAEEISKNAQREAKQREELSSQAQRSSTMMAEEEERARSTLNQAFQRIKEATGISSLQDLKKISQKDSRQHLMNEKEENEKVLQQLKEEREILNENFQDMKEKTAAKLCSDKQMLDVCKQRLQAQQRWCDASKERHSQLDKTVVFIRVWSERLVDRLKHIKLPEDRRVTVCPESDEYFLELLDECELKLDVLLEKLQGKDLPAIKREIEEVGFSVKAEGRLRANAFIKTEDDLSEEEDKGEKDEPDVLSREELKRQSQQIIDSKSKKKRGKKKKGRV